MKKQNKVLMKPKLFDVLYYHHQQTMLYYTIFHSRLFTRHNYLYLYLYVFIPKSFSF